MPALGQQRLFVEQARPVLDVLGVGGAKRDRLVKLAREAGEPGWWQEYGVDLSYGYASYLSLESEAATLKVFEPIVMYGLLQTRAYARAVVAGSGRVPPTEIDSLVEVKMARQGILARQDPARLHAVLDESVLRRIVGNRELMREQLRHLATMARRPNVCIQVLPFESGTVATDVTGPVVLIEFADPGDGPVVYLENLWGDVVEHPEDIQRYLALFDRLTAEALSPDQSLGKIEELTSAIGLPSDGSTGTV